MSAFLVYFASHWTLVIAAILVVAALGALSWFLKNWKYAAAAIAVAIAGFLYQGAVTSGIKEQMARDNAALIDTYSGRLATLNTIALKDAFQAKADADANTKLETLASETPINNSPCFDAATAHRVWAVRNAAFGGKPAVSASGVSNLLSWRKRDAR